MTATTAPMHSQTRECPADERASVLCPNGGGEPGNVGTARHSGGGAFEILDTRYAEQLQLTEHKAAPGPLAGVGAGGARA
jgi:hypothetical protein